MISGETWLILCLVCVAIVAAGTWVGFALRADDPVVRYVSGALRARPNCLRRTSNGLVLPNVRPCGFWTPWACGEATVGTPVPDGFVSRKNGHEYVRDADGARILIGPGRPGLAPDVGGKYLCALDALTGATAGSHYLYVRADHNTLTTPTTPENPLVPPVTCLV